MDSDYPNRSTSLTPTECDPLTIGRSYGYPPSELTGYMPPADNGLLQYWPILRKHRWTIAATMVTENCR